MAAKRAGPTSKSASRSAAASASKSAAAAGRRVSIWDEVLEGLDELGPSGDDFVREAISDAQIASAHRVLVIDGGAGRAAGQLAVEAGCTVVSTDPSERMTRAAKARVKADGLDARVTVKRLAVPDLAGAFDPMSFDAVLVCGAFRAAPLRPVIHAARGLLKTDGALAIAQLCWIARPSPSLQAYWDQRLAHDPVRTQDEVFLALADAYFGSGVAWALSSSAWERYYGPIKRNVARLRAAGRKDPLLDALEWELRMYAEAGGREALGCFVFVCRREEPEPDDAPQELRAAT